MTLLTDRRYCFEALVSLTILSWMHISTVWVSEPSPASRDAPLAVADGADALVSWLASRLVPPSTLAYNLTEPHQRYWGQAEQMRVVQALTRNKTGGFFIESGALDGERLSNTLLLERQFGWTGLLVEPAERNFRNLLSKRRRAWALQACLSNTGQTFTTVLHMNVHGDSATVEDGLSADRLRDQDQKVGGGGGGEDSPGTPSQHRVTCVPVSAALRALNRTEVDFFSLDIEGPEMGVLAHIPWHQLDIKILLVENFMAYSYNPQTDHMRDLMESNGYIAMHLMIDWIFVKRDSEYARDAVEIIRNMRRDIARRNSTIHFPFND